MNTFNEKHKLDVMLGHSYQDFYRENTNVTQDGLGSPATGNLRSVSLNALESLFARVNYTFKDKYLVGLNISMDGSSRTGKDAETALRLFDHPFGLFYSINGAWRLSSESFLRNISQIDELKLRASFGLTGNDDIGNYTSRRFYSQVKYRETTGDAATDRLRSTRLSQWLPEQRFLKV